jgi:hypothetical protein
LKATARSCEPQRASVPSRLHDQFDGHRGHQNCQGEGENILARRLCVLYMHVLRDRWGTATPFKRCTAKAGSALNVSTIVKVPVPGANIGAALP